MVFGNLWIDYQWFYLEWLGRMGFWYIFNGSCFVVGVYGLYGDD